MNEAAGRAEFAVWYVIQVFGGREASIMHKIEQLADSQTYNRVFTPRRVIMRKRKGEWISQEELLFPGYVFVDTASPEAFHKELSCVPAMTKLLASGDIGDRKFIPVSDDEKALICAFTGEEGNVMGMSKGVIEGDRAIIMSGPLVGKEALVRKIDRHKRVAWIEADMFGRKLAFKVGLEIVKKR